MKEEEEEERGGPENDEENGRARCTRLVWRLSECKALLSGASSLAEIPAAAGRPAFWYRGSGPGGALPLDIHRSRGAHIYYTINNIDLLIDQLIN